jgi:hypothetical protein
MLTIIPELCVPLPEDEAATLTLHEKAAALFKTVEFLQTFGIEVEPTGEDEVRARAAVAGTIGANPEAADPPAGAAMAVANTAGSVVHLKNILSEYDQIVVKSAVQIRTYVTNKLIEESNNRDPKIRMRALELLGKIGDVGLFVERTEVTVKHKTTIELQTSIKERISRLLQVKSKAEEIQELPVKAVSLRESADRVLADDE